MRATEFVTEEAKAVKRNGLSLKFAFNDRALIMKAFEPATKNPLAYVKFHKENKELYPQDLWVNDEYRNRGIAKAMYDSLKDEGYIINRSHDQTTAGSRFWDKHRGEDAYVWEATQVAHTQLWHGTSESADIIKQQGLRGGRHHAVFLTDNPDLALEYAVSDQERTGNDYVTLITVDVSKLDHKRLVGDLDHTTVDNWIDSLKETDQCMYLGDILPNMIMQVEDYTDQ